MFYLVKTPWVFKKFYSAGIWDMPGQTKALYLTFDDGPHPEATPFVLEELKKYNAKATFFCIGKNVEQQNHLYSQILNEGHTAGNHSYSHLNGWKTNDRDYFEDIVKAKKYIDSNLFRPPYGKISKLQMKHLIEDFGMKIIMWSVLSADFDTRITPEQCLKNVSLNVKPGSIIVFHDSEKAYSRMKYTLPRILKLYSEMGYSFEKINL